MHNFFIIGYGVIVLLRECLRKTCIREMHDGQAEGGSRVGQAGEDTHGW